MKLSTGPFISSMKKKEFSYLLAVGILFYVLNYLTPLSWSDDILYKFVWQPSEDAPKIPIHSIADVWQSQLVHYNVVNGRSIVHFVLQVFDGIIGKGIFNVFNTIFYVALVYLTSYFATKGSNSLKSYTLVTFLTFVCFPCFYNEFLMFVSAFNYVWTSVVILLFLLFLDKMQQLPVQNGMVWLSPLALLVGWTHEGITLPITLTLLIYSSFNFKKIRSSAALPFIIFFTLGTFICCISPGTLSRAADGQGEPFISMMKHKLLLAVICFYQMRILWLLLLLAAVCAVKRKEMVRQWGSNNRYIFITLFFSLGIVAASGATETRTLYYSELISAILLIRLVAHLRMEKMAGRLAKAANIAMLMLYVPVVVMASKNHSNYNNIVQQLQQRQQTLISVPQIHTHNAFTKYIFTCYMREPIMFGVYQHAQGFDQQNEHLRALKVLFHKPYLTILPYDLAKKVANNQIGKLTKSADGQLYIAPLHRAQVEGITLKLRKEDTASLSLKQRLTRYPSDEATIDKRKFGCIGYRQRQYLVFCAPTSNIDRRLQRVIIR